MPMGGPEDRRLCDVTPLGGARDVAATPTKLGEGILRYYRTKSA